MSVSTVLISVCNVGFVEEGEMAFCESFLVSRDGLLFYFTM